MEQEVRICTVLEATFDNLLGPNHTLVYAIPLLFDVARIGMISSEWQVDDQVKWKPDPD